MTKLVNVYYITIGLLIKIMKLSTIKYLSGIEIGEDWGNVLRKARQILSWKINDRLWAEASVHQISQSVFTQEHLIRLLWSEWYIGENINTEVQKKFIFAVKLILLKLQIFTILDRQDARSVWKKIIEWEWLDRIKTNKDFFYHISHWPVLLLSELCAMWFLPPELTRVFPRSCIVDDYNNWKLSNDESSTTYQTLANLKEQLDDAIDMWDKSEIKRLKKTIETIEMNAQRYLW